MTRLDSLMGLFVNVTGLISQMKLPIFHYTLRNTNKDKIHCIHILYIDPIWITKGINKLIDICICVFHIYSEVTPKESDCLEINPKCHKIQVY